MSDGWLVVVQSPADGWQHSPPTYVGRPVLEVSTNLGSLVLGDHSAELNLDILSDARIMTDEQGHLSVGTTESGTIEVAVGLKDGTILIWRVTQ